MFLVFLSSDLDLFQCIRIGRKVSTAKPCRFYGTTNVSLSCASSRIHLVLELVNLLLSSCKSQDTLRRRKLPKLCLPKHCLSQRKKLGSRARHLQSLHEAIHLRITPNHKDVCQYGRPKAWWETRQTLQDQFWYPGLHYTYVSRTK